MRIWILSLWLGLAGCGGACPVVNLAADTAKALCPVVVEYMGEDGKVHRMTLPHETMLQATALEAERQGVKRPKGAAPSSSGVIEPPTE